MVSSGDWFQVQSAELTQGEGVGDEPLALLVPEVVEALDDEHP